ncbi:hypothetical protein ACI76Z_06945 [Capnocytophaga canimorsus]|uniref:hypothetical protein n=1 Tax=Capnocytophaga canimorsus TaxID=28188 RepID=UPI000F6DB623|nr:hypothetical protein [Capnocytophaga canimorsus]VEJ19584.1 Uncharacterised protein [Capnocytophaga canimorsus]
MGNRAFWAGKKMAEEAAKLAAEKAAKNENIKKGVVAVVATIIGFILGGSRK